MLLAVLGAGVLVVIATMVLRYGGSPRRYRARGPLPHDPGLRRVELDEHPFRGR